jgi:hypothetical protein
MTTSRIPAAPVAVAVRARRLEVVNRLIAVLKLNPKNAWIHSRRQIRQIARSIRRLARGTTTRPAQNIHTEPIGGQYHPATIERYIRPVVWEISGKLLSASGKWRPIRDGVTCVSPHAYARRSNYALASDHGP